MKILIVSDSHGRHQYLEKAISKVGQIEMLVHLGDVEGGESYIENIAPCPVEMISGNNDYFTMLEREKIIMIGKYRVLLTHGHRYRVNFRTDILCNCALSEGVDIVMYGHTHIPNINLSQSVMLINPGSISQPRQDGRIPTFILMEIDAYGEAHFTLNYLNF